MKSLPRVKILLAIPNEQAYGPCTMVLDTIRVGYPNSEVEVWLNPIGQPSVDQAWDTTVRATKQECRTHLLNRTLHHAEWIKDRVHEHAADLGDQCPLVIVDGDVMFHKSCEGWQFEQFLAGYFVPNMWNDFAKCQSLGRLHTSHLWFNAPRTMLEAVEYLVPAPFGKLGEYCPLDLFSPSIKIVDRKPFFWDTTCVAYQLLGGDIFGPEHLDCYDHLTSASAFETMHELIENKEGFEFLHTEGYKDAALLKREMWPAQARYYAQKQKQIENS